MAAKLLEAKKLSASYGATQVLFGIDFALEAGQITAILGANGAGKTTTLRSICQMVRTTGSIELDGQQITGKATEAVVRIGVAHVPDGRGTFTALSVEDNLKLGAYAAKDKHAVAEDIERAYKRFPRLYHEPFFARYIRDPLEDLLGRVTGRPVERDVALFTKVAWVTKP